MSRPRISSLPCSELGCPEMGYRRFLCREHFLFAYRDRYKRRPGPRPPRGHVLPLVVYVWIAPDGRADYVGRGKGKRPHHHRHTPWWTAQHLLVSMTCAVEWEAMAKEGEWIGYYQPRHNIEGYRHGPDKRRTLTGLAL